MPKRQNVAEFLMGMVMFPMSVLMGLMIALLFHWSHTKGVLCVAFFAFFPLVGAVKSGQKVVIAGLCSGLLLSIMFYLWLPH
jgi:hypothetical protein